MVVMCVAWMLLCHISSPPPDLHTNVLKGAAHMALFAAYLMTIFARPAYPPGRSRKNLPVLTPAGFY